MRDNKGFGCLANFNTGEALKYSLFDAQVMAYKIIINRYLRDINMPIEAEVDEVYYKELLYEFNSLTNIEIDRDQARVMIDIVIDVIGSKGDYNKIRKAKKRTTRIYNEVRKMYKNGYYGEKSYQLQKDLLKLHNAFKEAFINIRRFLRKELYETIPSDLTITMLSGDNMGISDIYIWDEVNKYYKLNPEIRFSKTELRKVQLTISSFIFDRIRIGIRL